MREDDFSNFIYTVQEEISNHEMHKI